MYLQRRIITNDYIAKHKSFRFRFNGSILLNRLSSFPNFSDQRAFALLYDLSMFFDFSLFSQSDEHELFRSLVFQILGHLNTIDAFPDYVLSCPTYQESFHQLVSEFTKSISTTILKPFSLLAYQEAYSLGLSPLADLPKPRSRYSRFAFALPILLQRQSDLGKREPLPELVLDETPEDAPAPVQDGMEEESFHDDVSEIVKAEPYSEYIPPSNEQYRSSYYHNT